LVQGSSPWGGTSGPRARGVDPHVLANASSIVGVSDTQLVDGRTARRNRNREAVLDALIELCNEIDREPTIEAIADRAGVSYRSVYRYFDDRTDLMLAAIARVTGDVWDIFDVEDMGGGSLDERSAQLIRIRLAAYRELASLTRIAVRLRADEPAVAEAYDGVRAYLRNQLLLQFEPEFSAMSNEDRSLVLAAIDAMFQFETLDYLAHHEGMPDADITTVYTRHIRAHLDLATS
jgi:AcrR family transcriptional regulator